jgi:hypothetical protein
VTKLRNLLAAALLLLPAVTLNASSFAHMDERPGLGSTQQSPGMCWIYMMGRWWYIPC